MSCEFRCVYLILSVVEVLISLISSEVLFFVQTKEKYPKGRSCASMHPRHSCVLHIKTAPDIKSPRKDLGLPSSVSSANGYAPT